MTDRGLRTIPFLMLLLLAPVHAAFGEDPPSGPDEAAGYSVLPALPSWMENVHLTGTFEADFAWTDKSDTADRNSGAASDLFIGTVEVGIGVDATDWLAGNIVFLAEDLGTADETGLGVDEAILTFRKEDFPLSLVVGKRVQPFGTFESHLISDPMTQDAYETNRAGATVVFSGPMDLELSATVYKGEEMMAHLFESGLFDADAIARADHPEAKGVSSYVLSASVKPFGGPLSISGAFLSERGAGDRNDTASVGFQFETDVLKGFRVDGEYMKAVSREKYDGFDREFTEGVLSLTAVYEFVLRKRVVEGKSLFSGKRTRVVEQPLVVAARYEHFDDDGMVDASETFSVKDRYGIGAHYTIYREPDSDLAVCLAGEYRHTSFRVHPALAESHADSNEEVFARVGLSF